MIKKSMKENNSKVTEIHMPKSPCRIGYCCRDCAYMSSTDQDKYGDYRCGYFQKYYSPSDSVCSHFRKY